MAVFLSPVGGAAVQFFDNSGQVLTGGLLYTYLAGTTTPAATYTSNTGLAFHTNPIILDASGRIPNGGEVWLAQNIQYKFVLKDANSVLIGTWDNIIGINSNFLNYNVQEETQTATQGQTVFTLATISYTPGTNTLSVYVNGSKQIPDINYVETDSTTVTFLTGLNVGDVVDFTTAVSLSSGVTSADLVTYNEGQAGAITRSVTSRLQDYISVKDFGAVGDGATDDTAAFQSALDAVSNGGTINIPPGIYALTHVNFNKRGVTLQGESLGAVGLTNGVQLKCTAAISDFFVVQTYDSQIINMYINGNGLAGNVVRYKEGTTDITMRKVTVYGAATDGANVNLTPTVQYPIGPGPWNIETSSFEDCFFNGSVGQTGVSNFLLWNLQSLSISLYNCWFWNGEDPYNTKYHMNIKTGGVAIYNVVFIGLDEALYPGCKDIYFYQGALNIYRGRSECATNSIQAAYLGTVSLYDYVHAVAGLYDTFTKGANNIDSATIVGGIYKNIVIDNATGITMVNPTIDGAITGMTPYAYNNIGQTSLINTLNISNHLSLLTSLNGPATKYGVPYSVEIEGTDGSFAGGVLFDSSNTNAKGLMSFEPSTARLDIGLKNTSGNITETDTFIFDPSNSGRFKANGGFVLKSSNAHYWWIQVDNAGALSTTDLGTSF